MDYCLVVVSSAPLGSSESSPAKSSKKTKLSKAEDYMRIGLLSTGSVYLDPSFVKSMANLLLLFADRKRFVDIGPIQIAEWSLAHVYQVASVPTWRQGMPL